MFEGWGAGLAAAAAVGAVATSSAAGKAADAQKDAAQQASDTEMAQYNQNRADTAPWREAGVGALNQINAGLSNDGEFNQNFSLSDFTQDPGYQFRMDQGQQALDRSAAARGGALGGAAIKASERYGQDYASNEYQNAYNRWNSDLTSRFNRLASVAGLGQTANAQLTAQGTQTANSIGQNQLAAGNASAASSVATGNAIQSGVNTLGNWYQQQQYAPNNGNFYSNSNAPLGTNGQGNYDYFG